MKRTGSEAIRAALQAEMKRDRSVFLLGPSVGLEGGREQTTAGLIHEFGPGRVMDLPLAPLALLGAGLGAAYTGLRPVLEWPDLDGFAGSALARAAGMSHTHWNTPAPLVVRASTAAGWGVMPQGWKVLLASDPATAQGLLLGAIRDPNPVLFLEAPAVEASLGEVPDAPSAMPAGRARVVRTGGGLSIFTAGAAGSAALELAEFLAGEGTEAEVVDLLSLEPLDEATIVGSLRKTSKAMILYEAPAPAGWPERLAARLQEAAFADLDAPILPTALAAPAQLAEIARRLASY